MTYEQILSSVKSLTTDQQFMLASSILDELILSEQISDAMREEIRRRDIEFEKNPNNGEPWEDVEQEIFGS